MKKALLIVLALITLTAIFTGCTQPAEDQIAVPPQENAAPASGEGPSGKMAAEATDAEGKLIGWIDNNSVEIQTTPVDVLAFRVTDVLDQLEGIEDGATVKFSYKLGEQGQLIITKIEKVQ